KRGAKHLGELAGVVTTGHRAMMLFLIQIGSARSFKLARDIDRAYGEAFDRARATGVEAIAHRCGITCEGIEVAEPVPIAEGPGAPRPSILAGPGPAFCGACFLHPLAYIELGTAASEPRGGGAAAMP